MARSATTITRRLKPKLLLLLAITLLVAVFAVILFSEGSQTVRLVDGRILKLERYTFAQRTVRYEFPSRPFARKLARLLPDWVTARVGWFRGGATTVITPNFRNEPVLSVAFSMCDSSGKLIDGRVGTRLAVSADGGQVFDSLINYMGNQGVFSVAAFPRRGKKLRLRLMEDDKMLAEFKIPNPAGGPHIQWQNKRECLTVTNQSLEMSLAKFTTDRMRHRTQCTFLVREAGKTTTTWQPAAFELSDATGNRWRPPVDGKLRGVNGEQVTGGFFGALWQEERVWKVRVEFKSTNSHSEASSVRVAEFFGRPE